jgi:hypothetical protein
MPSSAASVGQELAGSLGQEQESTADHFGNTLPYGTEYFYSNRNEGFPRLSITD